MAFYPTIRQVERGISQRQKCRVALCVQRGQQRRRGRAAATGQTSGEMRAALRVSHHLAQHGICA